MQGHPTLNAFRFGIEQAVEQFALPGVKATVTMAPPEQRLGLHRIHHRAMQTRCFTHLLQKPGKPSAHLKSASLGALQHGVAGLALLHDPRG